MTFYLNSVCLAGNLTADPVSRTDTVTSFSIAVNENWKDKVSGEKKEKTTYIDVDCFGPTAKIAMEYLSKGRGVYLEGRLEMDKWQTQNGEARQKLKVVAHSVQFTTPPREREPDSQVQDEKREEPAKSVFSDPNEPPF